VVEEEEEEDVGGMGSEELEAKPSAARTSSSTAKI